MSASIITKLILEDGDFNNKLNRAKTSVDGFGSKFSTLTATLGKVAGALGVAMTAAEALNKVMKSSQTLSDEYDRVMRSAKTSVDEFFHAIGSGDFTAFNNGLSELIRKAREANDALDQLGNSRMSYNYQTSKNSAQFNEAMTILRDSNSSDDDKAKARATIEAVLGSQRSMSEVLREDIGNAIDALLVEGTSLTTSQVPEGVLDKIMAVDISKGRTELKKYYANMYQSYLEYEQRMARRYKHGYIGNSYSAANVDPAAYADAMNRGNAYYAEAILVHKALEKEGDKGLEELIRLAAEADASKNLISQWERQANRVGDTAAVIAGGVTNAVAAPVAGSMAAIKAEINKLRNDLENATDMAIRKELQAQIDLLNRVYERMDPKYVSPVQKDVYTPSISTPTGLSGDIVTPFDALIEGAQDYQTELQNINSLFTAMGNIMGQDGGTAAGYFANLTGSVANAIPILKEFANAQLSGAVAATASQNAALGPFGWMSALAAVASIIAAVTNIPKFASGGIVPGPNQGDNVHALLSGGEMILNAGQQSRLFSMINSGGAGGTIDMNLRGDMLFGVLRNHMMKTGKRLP